MQTLDVPNVLPDEYTLPPLQSSAKAVLRKNLVEFQPKNNVTVSYGGNNLIRMNISSANDFLIGSESYMSFDIKLTSNVRYGMIGIGPGGAHGLFRSVVIRDGATGMIIEESQQYGRKYLIDSLLNHSRDYVDQQKWIEGDGVDCNMHHAPRMTDKIMYTAVKRNGTSDYSVLMEGMTENDLFLFERMHPIGSPVIVQTTTAAGLWRTAAHTHIQDYIQVGANAVVYVENDFSGEVPEGPIRLIFHDSKCMGGRRGFTYYPNHDGITIIFKPHMSLLGLDLPMFLFKNGIEITLEMENPNVSCNYLPFLAPLTTHEAYEPEPTWDTDITLELSNIRFHAMLSTPHPKIAHAFLENYRSPQGLLFHVPTYKVRRRYNDGGTENSEQITFNVRTARELYVVFQDSAIAETTGQLQRISESLGTFIHSNLESMQLQIGAMTYPIREIPIDADGVHVYQQLLAMHPKLRNANPRLTKKEFGMNSLIPVAAAEKVTQSRYDSKSFIIGINLSRVNGENGTLAGLDLQTVPVNFNFRRSSEHTSRILTPHYKQAGFTGTLVHYAHTGNPIMYAFVNCDSFFRMSSRQNNIIQ